jgi:predicted dehydrogenase
MSRNKLRWGVISTANIGRWAVNPAIQASKNGELLAVASRHSDVARDFATKWNIPKHFGSYAELLDDPEIDAVYIPLPNSLHCEWVIRAAHAGKHILCEKPLGLTAAECHEMSAAAAANNVTFMEAFMYRFHPRTERVLEMVKEGIVGELKMIRSVFTFRLTNADNIRLQPELGGGSLMDVGCYCINLSRTMVGQEPVEVQAFATPAPSGVDDMMAGTLRFANGLLATFECGLNSRRRESYEIAGTEAYLRIPDAFLPGKEDVVIEEFRDGQEPTIHTIAGIDEYQCMVEHFADCAMNGHTPRYSTDEAALNMRVIEALYASSATGGKPVTV